MMDSGHLLFDPYSAAAAAAGGGKLLFGGGGGGNNGFPGQGLRTTMISMEDNAAAGTLTNKRRTPLPFFASSEELMYDDEYYYDEQLPEKKRRLTPDQVNMLEKSFEAENKLEPERKTELAKKLGLQPRQVAVWFQNRRARWKTKQLERDFDVLKASYDSLLASYDSVLKENDNLKTQVLRLTDKLQAPPDHGETPAAASGSDNLEAEDGLMYPMEAAVASAQFAANPEEGLSSGTASTTATGGSGVLHDGVNTQQLVDSTGDSYFPSDEDYYPVCMGQPVPAHPPTHQVNEAAHSEEDDTGNNCRDDLLLQWFHAGGCQGEYY